MRGVLVSEWTRFEALELQELAVPQPAAREVRLRVQAATCETVKPHFDWFSGPRESVGVVDTSNTCLKRPVAGAEPEVN